MSLIADALKAAQRGREEDAASPRAPVRPMLDGFFSTYRSQRRQARQRVLMATLGSGALVMVALFGFVVGTADGGGVPNGAAAAEPPPVIGRAPVVDSPAAVAGLPPASLEEKATPEPEPAPAPVRAVAPPHDVAAAEPEETGVQLSVRRAESGDYAELFAAALAAQNRGDVVQAATLYDQLLILRPDWAQAHSNLGAVYRSLGDAVRAERSFRRAIELDPELTAAWSNLGMLLSAAGRHDEAISTIQHALTLDPNAVATRVNLGTALHAAGSPAEARVQLQQALAASPRMPEAHYAMARVLEELRDTVAALEHYQSFLTLAAGRFPTLEAQVRAHMKILQESGRQ